MSPPVRPAQCSDVPAGAALQQALDAAPDGAAFCLADGAHAGPIVLRKRIKLWGTHEAVVRSPGTGTTVTVAAPGAQLLGFTVDGSGDRFDQLDSAIAVRADDVTVAGVRIEHATFGILVERAKRVALRGCDLRGGTGPAIGLRGDSIRLWETTDSFVEDNVVEGGRDVVVWYSSRNRIARNVVRGGRYGTHLMYSHQNRVEGNRYLGDVVGVFVMYCRDVRVAHNLVADAAGAAGIGLGIKESGNLTVEDNRFFHDQVGAYLDTTPSQQTDSNVFKNNVFRLGTVGVRFHGVTARNRFEANTFRDNRTPVEVEGRDDATDAVWDGNDWDDYAGYDFDGDGIGDVPFELRALSSDLVAANPDLDFFRGAPALALVDAVGRVLPLAEPRLMLVDEHPLLNPVQQGAR